MLAFVPLSPLSGGVLKLKAIYIDELPIPFVIFKIR